MANRIVNQEAKAKKGASKCVFNFETNSDDDHDHEGSLALSDIEFPSHVSDLESFHSDFESSVVSFLNEDDLTTSNHPEQNFEEQHNHDEQRHQAASGEDYLETSVLPELPEHAEENVNIFLAALKAATIQERSNESDEGSNHGERPDVSHSSSNSDSRRFISKESFPESLLAESSQSWGRDLSLNPDEIRNHPSSTPFCDGPLELSRNTDSRISDRFLVASKVPENGTPAVNDTIPASFSSASMLQQQTPALEPLKDNLAKTDNVHGTPETLKKHKDKTGSFSTPLQRKLWLNSLSISGGSGDGRTFNIKNAPVMQGVSFQGDSEPAFNSFEDSEGGKTFNANNGGRGVSVGFDQGDSEPAFNPFEDSSGGNAFGTNNRPVGFEGDSEPTFNLFEDSSGSNAFGTNNLPVSFEGASEATFNPFEDSAEPVLSQAAKNEPPERQGNPFENNDGFSVSQNVRQDDFSFKSGDDVVQLLDQDEAAFVSMQVFDKEEAGDVVDISMFSDYVLPGNKTARQSVVGVNDPDDKGEIRISFGKFFATRTEELGSLNNQDKNRARPQFESGRCPNESPEAAPPLTLYRPSPLEGDEDLTASPGQYSSKTFNVTESTLEQTSGELVAAKDMTSNHGITRSLPYGADTNNDSVTIAKPDDMGSYRGTRASAEGTTRDSDGYKEDKNSEERIRKRGTIEDKGLPRGTLRDYKVYKDAQDNGGYARKSGTLRDKRVIEGTSRDNTENNGGYMRKSGTRVDKGEHLDNVPNGDAREYLDTVVDNKSGKEDRERYQGDVGTSERKEGHARHKGIGVDKQGHNADREGYKGDVGASGNKEGHVEQNGTGVDKQGPKADREEDVGTNGDKEGYARYKGKGTREKKRDGASRFRRISNIDPNDSTMAALQYCQSSEGAKVLSMSTSELKLLSNTLAQVTQGESNEIYKVLVQFINRRKSLSGGSDTNIDSPLNFSDVFRDKPGEPSTMMSQPGSPDDTEGLSFYHSDTSCDVSPTASKFEALHTTAPSPPLDSSSPKSTGSSIAVQTESRDSLGSVPKGTTNTTSSTIRPRGSSSTTTARSSSGYGTSSSLPVQTTSLGFQKVTTVTDVGASFPGHSSGTPGTTAGAITTAHIVGTTGSLAGNMLVNTGTIPNSMVPIGTSAPHLTISSLTNQHSHARTFAPVSREAYGATYTSPMTVPPTCIPPTCPPQGPTYTTGQQPRTVYPPSEPGAPKHGTYITMSSGHGHSIPLPPSQHQPVFCGASTVYHTSSPVWTTTSVAPHLARTAPAQQAFPRSDRLGLGVRPSSLTDNPLDSGVEVPPWGGVGANQGLPHRPEPGWNWRTERSSEIQMVIPPSLDFPGVLCVGLSAEALLPIHNPTTRWIRCSSVIIRCSLNGVEVDLGYDSPFLIRETTLIGPKLTENVEVQFKCVVAGIYVAEMKVISIPVGSIGSDNETSSAIVTIQGFSEHPCLEIVTENGQTLDFGELHEGYNGIQPFRVMNKGRTAIPLKMLICSSSSPGVFIFSKKHSPDDSNNLEINNTVLKCVLPASTGLAGISETLTIWVELVGKNYHCLKQSNQAEAFSALINIQLDAGSVAKTLGNIALQGILGITKIQIPKAFQMAMCLSSQVGQKVARQLPFSNSGNISANVQLTIPKYPDMFIVTPEKFSIKPGTTVTAEVAFCPRLKDSYETVIQISELAYNKSYEVLLRGSSIDQPSPKDDSTAPSLLSNKSWLSWAGVDVGNATHRRLFLLNDSSEQSIQFQALVLGEHADFEIQRVKSNFTKGGNASEQITLRPKERIPIYVLFSPSSFGTFKSALVLNQAQGPRFKVPLYAYGGTSNLSITETDSIKQSSNSYNADLGQVFLGHRNIIKLTLKNTGSRAAFVKALCFSDHQIRLHYPKTHLSIVPSEFVLPERSSKELVIVFQPLQHDAKDCQSSVKKVATVVLYYGDEVLRQWYKRNISKQHELDGKRTTGNLKFEDVGFNKSFQDENCVAEEFDFPDLDDCEEVFDNHVSQVLLHLHGGPENKTKEPATTTDQGATVVAGGTSTPRATHEAGGRPTIRCETPAQKERTSQLRAVDGKVSDDESVTWTLIPEQLSLKVPVIGTVDSTKKVQLLNYTNRPLEFEFSWPAHCIAVTPHVGTIPPKNQALIHISVWSSIQSAGIDLPWSGTAYVNCDGARKALAIQIHKHLQNDDSPAPTLINKQLTKVDPHKDESLLHKMSVKPQKQHSPLTIIPEAITFGKTEVGKASTSILTIENMSGSSVRWKISSVAPAYAKVPNGSSELLRASYAVFRFSSHTGLIRSGQKIEVDVEFRARDVGEYCQSWDIQTNPESPLTSTKTQLKLFGEAVLPEVTENAVAAKKRTVRLSEPVKGAIPVRGRDTVPGKESTQGRTSVVAPSVSGQQSRKETRALVKGNANVFFESNDVQFPDTAAGQTSSVKIKLCNRSSVVHQFKIVSPQAPFTLKRASTLPVKPGHFLKMPVYFSPTEPSSVYSAVVSFENTKSAEILFVKVQGKSCKK